MRYILDTNILLFLARDKENGQAIYQKFDLGNTQNQVYFSIVSYSELFSILHQAKWGKGKLEKVEKILAQFTMLGLDKEIAKTYVEIDVYSQGKSDKKLPKAMSDQCH